MTHAQLSEAPQQIAGLLVPTGEARSKRQHVDLALENLTQEQLAHLALKFAAHRGDIALDEAASQMPSFQPLLTARLARLCKQKPRRL
jgi:hypothetical protein